MKIVCKTDKHFLDTNKKCLIAMALVEDRQLAAKSVANLCYNITTIFSAFFLFLFHFDLLPR